MKKTILIPALLLLFSSSGLSQRSTGAGAFARLGFHARGIGMGNTMTAVTGGDVATYYNPSLAAFSDRRTVAATFGILAFDRYLNFLSFTQALPPHAGLSVGLINAGMRRIDGRDADGHQTEEYSTTENQFYLSFSNRVDERVSLGVALKLYHSRIFEGITSTTVGFDVGISSRITDHIAVGVSVQDLNSKYKWDTKSLYGRDGKTTEDKFPTLRRGGLAYTLPTLGSTISVEYENSSTGTNIFRLGGEYIFREQFSVRGGVDRLDFGDNATGAKPTFGFSIRNSFNGWTPALSYAYVVESFAPQGMHLITLSTDF